MSGLLPPSQSTQEWHARKPDCRSHDVDLPQQDVSIARFRWHQVPLAADVYVSVSGRVNRTAVAIEQHL
eukprot:2292079-Prymnesium_polylepis.1